MEDTVTISLSKYDKLKEDSKNLDLIINKDQILIFPFGSNTMMKVVNPNDAIIELQKFCDENSSSVYKTINDMKHTIIKQDIEIGELKNQLMILNTKKDTRSLWRRILNK